MAAVDEKETGVNTPFALIISTAYGPMIIHRMDAPQSRPLFETGYAVAHPEIELLIRCLRERDAENKVVIDVGANFGCFSLALSRHVGPRGRVIAFEPQRALHYMLAGTAALNGAMNIEVVWAAVGAYHGYLDMPGFDYTQPLSFGSVEFGPEQREPLSQQRRASGEKVRLTTLDSIELTQLDLLKIDAEGMEMDVLAGAVGTIEALHPIIYIEWLKVDKAVLRATLEAWDYAVQEAPGSNFLALPQ